VSKMKAVHAGVLGAMVLVAAVPPGAFSKTPGESKAAQSDSFDRHASDRAQAGISILREIDDPHSGARWLLLMDAHHPGGPGRLVLADAMGNTLSPSRRDGKKAEDHIQPVIHAGEKLILEEHSPVVDARLDAIALNPAAVGGMLRVRLVIGGSVVRALAVAPGCAILTQEKGGQR